MLLTVPIPFETERDVNLEVLYPFPVIDELLFLDDTLLLPLMVVNWFVAILELPDVGPFTKPDLEVIPFRKRSFAS